MASILKKVKAGSRFRLVQSLTKPINIADEYPLHGLVGLTAVASIYNQARERLIRLPMQTLSAGQEEVIFIVPEDETIKWVVGELVYMDILYSNGVSSGRILSPTITISVKEGFTRPQGAVGAEKVFSPASFNAGYKTEASAS